MEGPSPLRPGGWPPHSGARAEIDYSSALPVPASSNLIVPPESVLEHLRCNLDERGAKVEAARANAGVAMVLRRGASDLELCFIIRAEREGDRWSGHVALPGGRPEPHESQLLDTAVRETREEIALDLRSAEYLGALQPVPIVGAQREPIGVLAPYVFLASRGTDALSLEAAEVADAFWTPMSTLFDPSRQAHFPWRDLRFPAIRLGDHLLWGLTLRVVEHFASEIGRPLTLSWPSL